MPSYKLQYFDARGRAENIRMLLALAKVDFEDYRFKDREEFTKIQPDLPFSQVPALIIDDKDTLCQSRAIERYIANVHGFAGKSDLEKARVDMVVDTVEDLLQVYVRIFFEQDEAKKAELKKVAESEKVPRFMKNLESMLKANNGGDGFIVGDSVTFADIDLANIMADSSKNAEKEGGDILADYPKLKGHMERIHAIPQIQSWIEKRPQSEF